MRVCLCSRECYTYTYVHMYAQLLHLQECIQLARDAEKDAKEREKEQKLPPPSTDAYYKSKDRQMAAESWYNLKSRPYYQDKVKGSILIASYYEVLTSHS